MLPVLPCAHHCHTHAHNTDLAPSPSLRSMGATAVLFSNRASDGRIAKYRLERALRVHAGASDRAYKCVG